MTQQTNTEKQVQELVFRKTPNSKGQYLVSYDELEKLVTSTYQQAVEDILSMAPGFLIKSKGKKERVEYDIGVQEYIARIQPLKQKNNMKNKNIQDVVDELVEEFDHRTYPPLNDNDTTDRYRIEAHDRQCKWFKEALTQLVKEVEGREKPTKVVQINFLKDEQTLLLSNGEIWEREIYQKRTGGSYTTPTWSKWSKKDLSEIQTLTPPTSDVKEK